MMDLCDYQNKTFSSDKVDDNYHTGEFGIGVQVTYDRKRAFLLKISINFSQKAFRPPSGNL